MVRRYARSPRGARGVHTRLRLLSLLRHSPHLVQRCCLIAWNQGRGEGGSLIVYFFTPLISKTYRLKALLRGWPAGEERKTPHVPRTPDDLTDNGCSSHSGRPSCPDAAPSSGHAFLGTEARRGPRSGVPGAQQGGSKTRPSAAASAASGSTHPDQPLLEEARVGGAVPGCGRQQA